MVSYLYDSFWMTFAVKATNDPNSYHEGQNILNDLGLLTSQSWPEAIVIAIQEAV